MRNFESQVELWPCRYTARCKRWWCRAPATGDRPLSRRAGAPSATSRAMRASLGRACEGRDCRARYAIGPRSGILTNQMMSPAPPPQEYPFASPSISIWLPWYFTQRALSALTIPLFFFLLVQWLKCVWAGCIDYPAMVRASEAAFGSIAAFIAVLFAWIPAFAPAVITYSLLPNVPGLWIRRDLTTRTSMKVGAYLGC